MASVLTSASSRGAAGRTVETVAVVALTVAVLATVAAVVVRGASTADPAAAPGDVATVAAPAEGQTVVATAASTTEAHTADDDGFTVGELAAGEVSAERFDAFWQAELERIGDAPCPAPTAPGTTVVVASVGATPPAHLGDDYVDYAPVLADARAAAAAACA